jgi:transposase-like protein
MNRLPTEKRAQIIGLLFEGMSMRAITRVTGVSINTVTKLLEDVGLACNLYTFGRWRKSPRWSAERYKSN